MKKGKVFGKTQVAVTVMVLALAAAIYLNMKYAPTAGKYLGEASYVSNSNVSETAVQTSAKAEKSDYFETAKKERETARTEIAETVTEILKDSKLSEEDKKTALSKLETLTARAQSESNIETLLKAKGFEKAVVIIGDGGVSVVVKSEGLTSAQTLQIQDIVTAEAKVPLSDIKIIPVA